MDQSSDEEGPWAELCTHTEDTASTTTLYILNVVESDEELLEMGDGLPWQELAQTPEDTASTTTFYTLNVASKTVGASLPPRPAQCACSHPSLTILES